MSLKTASSQEAGTCPRPISSRVPWLLFYTMLFTGCLEENSGALESSSVAADRAAPAALDRLPGDGFVVWESNRTGSWRIWHRRLDGSDLRQLTPEPTGGSGAGQVHCCPHVAPDGAAIVYLSSTQGSDRYPLEGAVGELHLIAPDGSGDRLIAQAARSYSENRVAVWRSPRRLIFPTAELETVELDLESGDRRVLLERSPDGYGCLIDPTLSHATSGGVPAFSPYDPGRRAVALRERLPGCQPYFSHDGRWGFWAAGAGGPLNRIDLRSREVASVLRKNDPRMPDGYGYAYFPMLSSDGSLFAYAASRGEHSHFEGDYEVFVAEVDPETLELIDLPVRITEHPASDRFPDVFQAPLELGRWRGEAPFTLRLEAPRSEPADGAGAWSFDLGDGTSVEGSSVEHTYTRPGSHRLEAHRGEHRLRGHVLVAPARPPEVTGLTLRKQGERLLVHFDEPVQLVGPGLAFESGRGIVEQRLAADSRSLELVVEERIRTADALILDGISDRAEPPNPMPRTRVAVEPPRWPVSEQGLVFLWQSAAHPNLVPDPAAGAERAYTLNERGLARLDHAHTMVLDGGRFELGAEHTALLHERIQATNELTLELTLERRPEAGAGERRRSGEPVVVAAFAHPTREQNFRLRLDGAMLLFSLRVGNRGPEANPEIELFELPAATPTHVALTYTPGRLRAYRDGVAVIDSHAARGDFFQWRPYPLVFGGGTHEHAGLRGRLEGIALYDRVLSDEEIAESAARYRSELGQRPAVPRFEVLARLLRRSRPPTLREISPYRQGLVVCEYQVVETIGGRADLEPGPGAGQRIRVAHWSILDGEPLAINQLPPGASLRLTLEPFERNPQLEPLVRIDDLAAEPGAPAGGLWFAIDPTAGR